MFSWTTLPVLMRSGTVTEWRILRSIVKNSAYPIIMPIRCPQQMHRVTRGLGQACDLDRNRCQWDGRYPFVVYVSRYKDYCDRSNPMLLNMRNNAWP